MARVRIEFGEPRRKGLRKRVSGVLIQSGGAEEKIYKSLRSWNRGGKREAGHVFVYLVDTDNSKICL
jgi:hypothetical protein